MRHLSLISKHFTLGNTETVLFIRDDERQIVIDDLLLDQGMRADDDIRFVRSNLFVGKPFFLCRHGSGDEHHFLFDSMCGKQFRHRLIVLSREDFSRDHQRALIPIFTDRQECQDRDDRLAGTNVSLDQAVHDGAAL